MAKWLFSRRERAARAAWAKWSEHSGRQMDAAREVAFRAGFHMGVAEAQRAEIEQANLAIRQRIARLLGLAYASKSADSGSES